MKTYNEFICEAVPLLALGIPALMKAGGYALTAYSAYNAAKNLQKGNYRGAALDALSMIPGGTVFKGARALGAGQNVARAGSALQSANRLNLTGLTPNARATGIEKAYDFLFGGGASAQPQSQQQKPQSGLSQAEQDKLKAEVDKKRAAGQMSNLPANYKQQELDAGRAAERYRTGAGLPKSGTGTNLSPTPTPTTQPPKPSLAMRGSQTGTVDSTGKFTARPFTSAEKKSFEASRANTPGMNKTKPTSTVAKSDFKMPSFKAALNMPSFQSTLKTPIKPAQDAQARQAGQSAQRLQQRMRQMRNTPAALAKRL